MRLDDIERASNLRRAVLKVKQAWACLASGTAISTVSVPTGSVDGVTGQNHCIEVTLAGPARVDLRRLLKQEYERLAGSLADIGVTVPPLGSEGSPDTSRQ